MWNWYQFMRSFIYFKDTFFFCSKDDQGKELEQTMNKSGMNGHALFVKCDISNETDVQVCIQYGYMTSL